MAQIQNGEHVTIADVALLPNMEAPEEFNQFIRQFLEMM